MTTTRPAYAATDAASATVYFTMLNDIAIASSEMIDATERIIAHACNTRDSVTSGTVSHYNAQRVESHTEDLAKASAKRETLYRVAQSLFGSDDEFLLRALAADEHAAWDYSTKVLGR